MTGLSVCTTRLVIVSLLGNVTVYPAEPKLNVAVVGTTPLLQFVPTPQLPPELLVQLSPKTAGATDAHPASAPKWKPAYDLLNASSYLPWMFV